MKVKMLFAMVCLTTIAAFAAKHSDFSGSWQLNTQKSQNIGMMVSMKMTYVVEQSTSALEVTAHTNFQGRAEDRKSHFDLTGNAVTNESPMGGPAQTVSKWNGASLVTTWASESAVAGSPKIVRTETWSVSPDGKTLTIESVRGTNPALVMVFDKNS